MVVICLPKINSTWIAAGYSHQGAYAWLVQMETHLPKDEQPQLLRSLKRVDERRAAARTLTALLETLSENFDEYTEYHATTSKADRGELTYVLIDFLRLRCEYRRVAWNLWPFILAHAAIVQAGLTEIAGVVGETFGRSCA